MYLDKVWSTVRRCQCLSIMARICLCWSEKVVMNLVVVATDLLVAFESISALCLFETLLNAFLRQVLV